MILFTCESIYRFILEQPKLIQMYTHQYLGMAVRRELRRDFLPRAS